MTPKALAKRIKQQVRQEEDQNKDRCRNLWDAYKKAEAKRNEKRRQV